MKKTIVVCSDPHGGHRAGLVHPAWYAPETTHTGRLQRAMYENYAGWVQKYHKPDLLFFLGDAIEGKGQKSGGTELLTADRREQVGIAKHVLGMWEAERTIMVYGTTFHTGSDGEDWERILADELGAEIHGQAFVEVEGVTFHLKHHMGSSSIPHGRYTPIAKEHLWLQLWQESADWPRAQVVLRGHVHYHADCGDHTWRGMTVPALQAASTKYGRRLSAIVHFGIVVFTVEDGRWDWTTEIVTMQEERPAVIRI